MQFVLRSETDSSALWGLNGPCGMTDTGKENIGILEEISVQLYFLSESEAMLWSNYQRGSSVTAQTCSSMDIRA